MTNKQNNPMTLVKSRPERCPLEILDEARRILHRGITDNQGAAEELAYDNYPLTPWTCWSTSIKW